MVFGGIINANAQVQMVTTHRMVAQVPQAVAEGARIGDSVAFNGVCLTVIERNGVNLTFDLSDETLRRTTFGALSAAVANQDPSKATRAMHVEPALRFGDAIGGHFISGHVHGVGSMVSLDTTSGELVISLPPEVFPHRPIFKDSIAIDGVSLTVAKAIPESHSIAIALIPHTIKLTLFATYSAGEPVNIELNAATLQREPALPGEVKDDVYWMKKAIEEGEKGRLTAPPNPWVGAVLVDPWGSQIDQGHHERPGEKHAERHITAPMGGCTLYVTLEPCCHTGRTPPCTDFLLTQKPKRVVVGVLDPDPRVSGSGVKILRDAGITVDVGVAEDLVRYSLRPYLWHRSNGNRPYVVCKLALSQDGCFAYTTDSETNRQWITGEHARRHGHGERAKSQRIVVGKNTDIMDKPRLDVRYDFQVDRQPERVVSTRELTWLEPTPNIVQALVEGGPELEDDLLSKGLVNEFVLYRSTKFLGLHGVRWTPSFEAQNWELKETQAFDDGDTMQRFVKRINTTSQTVASANAKDAPTLEFDSIEDALDALRRGLPIVVMDDESRENEGDLMLLADRLTMRSMKTLLNLTTGIVCATMTKARAQQLNLPLMVGEKENKESHRTKFTLSVDAAHGITTGVSAADRLVTLTLLAKASTKPTELVRPGHVFPLIAAAGGLLERRGHTEAGVELARMAGGMDHSVMVISELYDKGTGRMMNALQCRQLGFPMIHIEALAQRLSKWALWASVPLQTHPGNWHVAVVAGCRLVGCGDAVSAYSPGVNSLTDAAPPAPRAASRKQPIALRIHSECFTGDVLGSSLCDCGNQLHAALKAFGSSPSGGLVIFPPEQEGRGIGLAEKLKAYTLQRGGLDTYQANEALGHGRDERTYDNVIFALRQIGILPSTHRLILATANPAKRAALETAGYELEVRPITADPTIHNAKYLEDKHREFTQLAAALPSTQAAEASHHHAHQPTAHASGESQQTALMKQAPLVIPLTNAQKEYLATKVKVVVVQAEWHRHVSDGLLEAIQNHLKQDYHITSIKRIFAPGSFEVPRIIAHAASRQTAEQNKTTVYIGMGILVKGDTDHYDLVARESTAAMQRLAMDRNLWVVNCVLACHNMQQVEDRCLPSRSHCVAPHMAQAAARLALAEIDEGVTE